MALNIPRDGALHPEHTARDSGWVKQMEAVTEAITRNNKNSWRSLLVSRHATSTKSFTYEAPDIYEGLLAEASADCINNVCTACRQCIVVAVSFQEAMPSSRRELGVKAGER